MDITKKELIDFIESFGDPNLIKDRGLKNSLVEVNKAIKRYWIYSKPDDYIISNDDPNGIYKFREMLFDKSLKSKNSFNATNVVSGSSTIIGTNTKVSVTIPNWITPKNSEPIKPVEYCDLYAILKRDIIIQRCISK